MQFQPILILSSFLAVVQLILTMVPGVWYTRKGTVSREMRRSLSTIAFNLLLPCVIFMNIADNITASTIASYWPFAMNTTISMIVGMLLGWIINEVFGTPKHLRYHVIACTGFANLNSLPLMITTAVCNQEKMPFYQTLGSECVTVGWTYVAVSSAVNQIFGFPIAKWLLVKRAEPPRSFAQVVRDVTRRTLQLSGRSTLAGGSATGDAQLQLPAPASAKALRRPTKAASAPDSIALTRHPRNGTTDPAGGAAVVAKLPLVREGDDAAAAAAAEEEGRQLERVELGVQAVDGKAQQPSAKASPSDLSAVEDEDEGGDSSGDEVDERAAAGEEPAAAPAPAPPGRFRKAALAVWHYIYEFVLILPTITAVLSLGVGCAAPIRDLFFPQQSAPLGFITGAIQSLQNSYVFVASFVLGAAMAWGPGPGTRSVGLRAALAVVGVRFLVLPVLGCIIVVGTIKAGWYTPRDPVFAFLLLLQYSVPTSNQVQNMASMFQNHEKEIGALIFWEYVIATIAIPGWMIFYLFLMDRFDLYPGA